MPCLEFSTKSNVDNMSFIINYYLHKKELGSYLFVFVFSIIIDYLMFKIDKLASAIS